MTSPLHDIVVIGNGMVGQRFLEALTAGTAASTQSFALTVLGEEPRAAYDRVQLSSLFRGRTEEQLSLAPPSFFQEHGIALHLNERALHIDRSLRCVHTASGRQVRYDTLVLATGSSAFVPPLPGRDRPGCFVYRTIEDLQAIRSAAQGAHSGAVIGGGLLGLEAAQALRDLGLETHVVELAPRLMALQVDELGGALLRRMIEARGVHVHTGKLSRAITAAGDAHGAHGADGADGAGGAGGADGTRHRLSFADGAHLEVDVLVFSAGIRPRDELARDAALAVGERGGIVIDETCRTSDPAIYAIGECALWNGRTFGLVAPGYRMAEVAAAHIASQITATPTAASANAAATAQPPEASAAPAPEAPRFTGSDMSAKLKLMGVDVASVGDAHAETPGARCYTFMDERRGVYKKLIVDEQGRRLLGGVLVGEADSYLTWVRMLREGAPLPERPEELILPVASAASAADGSGAGSAGPAGSAALAAAGATAPLPATAQICSCNNVSHSAICAAIEQGCTTLGTIRSRTRAASTCGGCAPLVARILKAELQRRGAQVDNHLCEHFPYSRQQLFHLVRVAQLRSFADVLARHGKGRGCDVCKPAIASILASCWNEFILAPEQAPLQDTNDYFLANMQKDGTYSVVPRIPGGEITPEKLIAIGEVATRYGLYTKITGAQRIDLLGARVHQLPLIWRDLIAAGFESGHAYGKAVRTVKSCVGSTWCRYGVQDSVGLAIELENRYKGLRSPHKLKFAVSGCTRECAEAQGKDVGVIATERGWNLYVCGNGGMKPRHAELLASDLDQPTLIRYIDRFLMFYVRTADRLQRTATWRDGLEGGLEYLRGVICQDSLGIAAELEADMARVIGTYRCEWKAAIESPETLKRFRHFVNSDAPDDQVLFVHERGQIRPVTALERRAHAAAREDVPA